MFTHLIRFHACIWTNLQTPLSKWFMARNLHTTKPCCMWFVIGPDKPEQSTCSKRLMCYRAQKSHLLDLHQITAYCGNRQQIYQRLRPYFMRKKLSEKSAECGEPAISLHCYTVPLVQWSTRLLPVIRDQGSIPRGGTNEKLGFSC